MGYHKLWRIGQEKFELLVENFNLAIRRNVLFLNKHLSVYYMSNTIAIRAANHYNVLLKKQKFFGGCVAGSVDEACDSGLWGRVPCWMQRYFKIRNSIF